MIARLAAILAAGVIAASGITVAQAKDDAPDPLILDTPGFIVRIEVRCPEGHVTCDDVAYRGESRRSGRAIFLKGRTLHTTCADGVTPCRFLGYRFRNGAHTYFVSDAGELVVTRGGKVIVRERGEWR